MKRFVVMMLACAAGLQTVSAENTVGTENLYVKELVFPVSADSLTRVAMAGRVVPTSQQLAWQQLELTAFLHFGMNTFTDREWGDGTESPALFLPDSLDTDQWVRELKNAGFKMVILTAKHHDGFCLWPTATTAHSVASSPWRDGKGDVVADLRKSCDKYGMKLGIYLSPWDRNAECYGDSPRYNDMFVAQLTELLTNYGKIDEVWFDGACGEGPNGKRQQYDWPRFRETMRRLQPEAVLAITGDDVRWVGNEGGVGRETEWSVTPLVPKTYAFADSVNAVFGLNEMSPSLGGSELISRADRVFWWPSEVDVSLRPGWFYHDAEAPKPLSELASIYLKSVGRNSVLLLNVPPDNHGRIAEADVKRLRELRRWIDGSFSDNCLDRPASKINCVVIEEDITRGQRVEKFDVLAWRDGRDTIVASGTTIGKKRILTFDAAIVDSLSLNVRSSRGEPHAAITGAYNITMPETICDGTSEGFIPEGYKTLDCTIARQPSEASGKARYIITLEHPARVAGLIYLPDPEEGLLFNCTLVPRPGDTTAGDAAFTEFGNVAANPIPQKMILENPVTTRQIEIVGESTPGKAPALTSATLLILTDEK